MGFPGWVESANKSGLSMVTCSEGLLGCGTVQCRHLRLHLLVERRIVFLESLQFCIQIGWSPMIARADTGDISECMFGKGIALGVSLLSEMNALGFALGSLLGALESRGSGIQRNVKRQVEKTF